MNRAVPWIWQLGAVAALGIMALLLALAGGALMRPGAPRTDGQVLVVPAGQAANKPPTALGFTPFLKPNDGQLIPAHANSGGQESARERKRQFQLRKQAVLDYPVGQNSSTNTSISSRASFTNIEVGK